MDISPVTIGAISAAIAVPIFMAVIRKINAFKFSSNSTKSFWELTEEYKSWEKAASYLLILFAAVTWYILWVVLRLLSSLHMSYIEKGVYLIPQASITWAALALFFAMFLSYVPMQYLYLGLLGKERYAEYTDYVNEKLDMNTWKVTSYMAYVIIPICFVFTFLTFDCYARVTNSSFIVNRFFSVGEVEYSFDQINTIELIRSFKGKNGDIVRKPYYSIEFNDKTNYNFYDAPHDLNILQQEDIMQYIQRNTGHEIVINDPYALQQSY